MLAVVNGHFATGFLKTAEAYGIDVERIEVEYGAGAPAAAVEQRLTADSAHQYRAVLVVHNETSTEIGRASCRERVCQYV